MRYGRHLRVRADALVGSCPGSIRGERVRRRLRRDATNHAGGAHLFGAGFAGPSPASMSGEAVRTFLYSTSPEASPVSLGPA